MGGWVVRWEGGRDSGRVGRREREREGGWEGGYGCLFIVMIGHTNLISLLDFIH